MDKPRISVSRRQFLVGLGLLVVVVALGVGGYLFGRSTGEDLDAARAHGTALGQTEGSAKGASEGFTAGRKEGRNAAYAKSYDRSYRDGYQQAYEDAGLNPPDEITVPDRSSKQ
jgi:hypothetical protein